MRASQSYSFTWDWPARLINIPGPVRRLTVSVGRYRRFGDESGSDVIAPTPVPTGSAADSAVKPWS